MTREAVTLRCLECSHEVTIGADEQSQYRAYNLGWRLIRTRYRQGQLCPVHARRWSRRRQKRREALAKR